MKCGATAQRSERGDRPTMAIKPWTVAGEPHVVARMPVEWGDSSTRCHDPFLNMTFFRTMHRFRAGLLALFVVAQVAGIIPLLYDHTLNVFERSPVAGHAHVHVASTLVTP